MEDKVFGKNPVLEIMESGRDINKLVVLNGSKDNTIQKIIDYGKKNKVVIQFEERKKLDRLSDNQNHQGVIAYVAAYDYVSVEEIIESAKVKGEEPFVIVCDEITDPHNLGSIMRTANAVGAHGIIIPKRRSVALNQTVAKTSCGAVEYVPVARVTNIAQTLELLKSHGIWVAGTDMDGDVYYEANLKGSIAIVIGNEGKGISRLVKEKCDFMITIPMAGEIQSLNASVAAGVIMYEVMKQNKR